MIRRILFTTALVLASPAESGDLMEGYFYIVGSTPSTIRVEEIIDVAVPAFRDTLSTLNVEWSDKCEVPVDIWHTNLMHNENNPWTPDHWFAFIAMEETKAMTNAAAPATDCITDSYIKFGEMVIPTLYQICAQPEAYPEIHKQSCN